jgi:tRNA uridine 5-carboxymethylaminomethyl modification enzyme
MGRSLGLVDDERWKVFEQKQHHSEAESARLHTTRIHPDRVPAEWAERVLKGPLARDQTALALLRRPEVNYEQLIEVAGEPDWSGVDDRVPAQVRLQMEVRAKYAGYIERQQEEVERQRRNDETVLPVNLDYAAVAGLSTEVRQRLNEAKPMTLGQASRIPGITPAAISILLVHLKKRAMSERSQVA